MLKKWTPYWARCGHPWAKEKAENGHFPQRIVVFRFTSDLPTFSAEGSYPKRPKNAFFFDPT